MSNNIEEDIKIVDKLKESKELCFGGWIDRLDDREKQAIENILNTYKENQKIIDKIKSEIKRLEKEQAEYQEDYYDEYEKEIILLSNLLKEE